MNATPESRTLAALREQPNRAFDVIQTKLAKDPAGQDENWGLKCFP